MASDYGLNFGFLRSNEGTRWAEGRFSTPAGSALQLGTVVEIDAATPGYLKQSAAAVGANPGVVGVLVQELANDRSIYESNMEMLDSFQTGVAKADRLSVITGGAGVKIWVKNTTGETRADGRVVPSVTMHSGLNAVGQAAGWDGAKWVVATAAADTLGTVTHVDGDRVEIVLNA